MVKFHFYNRCSSESWGCMNKLASIPSPVLKGQHPPYLLFPSGMEDVYQFIHSTCVEHFLCARMLETQGLNTGGSLPQRHQESRRLPWSEIGWPEGSKFRKWPWVVWNREEGIASLVLTLPENKGNWPAGERGIGCSGWVRIAAKILSCSEADPRDRSQDLCVLPKSITISSKNDLQEGF